MRASQRAIQYALAPPVKVAFQPVPHKLLRAACGAHANETCHSSMGSPWGGQAFDPWAKGDLVACCFSRVAWLPNQQRQIVNYETWYMCRRATVPSATRLSFATSDGITRQAPCYTSEGTVWRVAYHWLSAAAKLYDSGPGGFESREDLEKAMENAQ